MGMAAIVDDLRRHPLGRWRELLRALVDESRAFGDRSVDAAVAEAKPFRLVGIDKDGGAYSVEINPTHKATN